MSIISTTLEIEVKSNLQEEDKQSFELDWTNFAYNSVYLVDTIEV